MINNILATDNKNHFQTLKDFEIKMKQFNEDPKVFEQEESLMVLSGFLIHSSDFYGLVKPFHVSNIWSSKVNQEFTAQFQLETKLGLPTTPYFKDLDNPIVFAKNEIGFLKVIVLPLWEVINKFTDDSYEQHVRNMKHSIAQYEAVIEQNQAKLVQ